MYSKLLSLVLNSSTIHGWSIFLQLNSHINQKLATKYTTVKRDIINFGCKYLAHYVIKVNVLVLDTWINSFPIWGYNYIPSVSKLIQVIW